MNFIITERKDYFNKVNNLNQIKLNYINRKEIKDIVLPKTIAVDTETTGLISRHDTLFAIQIGTGKDNYLIDLETIPFKEVRPLLEQRTLVFHNAAFDLGFLYRKGFFPSSVKDTMLASMILYNGKKDEAGIPYSHSWGACMQRELNIKYDKTQQKNIHVLKLSTIPAINYCFQDVDKLLELSDTLEHKLKENEALETLYLHYDYICALAYIEQCGLPISSERWLEKMKSDIQEKDAKAEKVINYIYDNLPEYRNKQLNLFENKKELNILLSSTIQMIPVFLKLEIPILNEEGKHSLEKDIVQRSTHEFAKLWVEYKEIEHDITTFGKNIYEKIENERIYTHFKPIIDTARISTRKGEINFLNFPANEKTRRCFYSEKNVIIGADFTNQEAYILGDQSKDKVTLDSVLNGADLHIEFAKKLYPEIKDLSYEEIKKNHNEKRTAAKSPRFALNYGGNSFTLAVNLNISIEEAKKIEEAYRELHAGVFEWGNKVLEAAIKVGYLEHVEGFKLILPNFEKFTILKKRLDSTSKAFWELYREGKVLYLAQQKDQNTQITNPKAYLHYIQEKKWISEYFSLKGSYFRLSLNAKIQCIAAHQTKRATVLLFKKIRENNHLGIVKIINVIHDRFCRV